MCGQPDNKSNAYIHNNEYLQLIVKQSNVKNIQNDSVTICWDPPSVESNETIDYYDLFYFTEPGSKPKLLKSVVASDSSSVIIYRRELPLTDSIFYFCVQSITKSGLKSDIHFSSDPEAVPDGGWILLWK